MRRHTWAKDDKDYIRSEYRHSRASVENIARKFGVTTKAIRMLISRMGLVKYLALWAPTQETFLRENYDKLPTAKIARMLRKTEGAVRHKSHRLNLSKFDRFEWFTLTEVCTILGVSRDWLNKRLNNGFKFDIRPFYLDRIPKQGSNAPWYISESSLCDFIRRYPEELQGHNVDMTVLVQILAGIKVGNYEHCEDEAERETA